MTNNSCLFKPSIVGLSFHLLYFNNTSVGQGLHGTYATWLPFALLNANASCSLRKRGMFNLHSTFCLKNEPMNERRYDSLRLILAFVAWRGTLLWSVICCGPLWNRRAQPHGKQVDSRELSKLTQEHHNAPWIHKQTDQEMEKVITRYDVV